MERLKYILIILFSIIFNACSKGQNEHQATPSENNNEWMTFWENEHRMNLQQDKVSLEVVDGVLKKNPATKNPLDTTARRMALAMIDQILHQKDAAHYLPVQKFYHSRIKNAVEEMKSAKIDKGAKIWKLYNDGFVVKTATVTIGFDLIRGANTGSNDFALPNKLAQEIVDECDILFVSHRHIDHADPWMTQAFIEQGKPVITPPDIWKGKAIYAQVKHLPRVADSVQSIDIQDGKQELSVVVYPGRQGDNKGDPLNNSVVVTTPEQLTFAQTGDQSSAHDWDWIDNVKNSCDIDVLITDCWYPQVKRIVQGFDPKIVLTGHENELGHSVDHREPYWLTFRRFKDISRPYYVFTWGESYYYSND